MRDVLIALLGLISAGLAAWFLYSFQRSENVTMYLILGIVFALLAVGFGAFFMFGRVNRHDEIHVTE